MIEPHLLTLSRVFLTFGFGLAVLSMPLRAEAQQSQRNVMTPTRNMQLRHLETRALGGQDVSQEAQQLRRNLRVDSNGGFLSGRQLQLDREARRLSQPSLIPPSGRFNPSPVERATTGDGSSSNLPSALPSMRNEVVPGGALIDSHP